MKLGLIIKITNGGVAEAYSINKSEDWSRFAEDVRPAINSLSNFDGTGKSVIFARFLGTKGYMLCIIKARPEGSGRGGDNVAAWIHIPSGCNMESSAIVLLLEQVETAISASRGIDVDALASLFSIERNSCDVLFPATNSIISSNNKGYALRYYNNGDYTLQELLGTAIAQKEYSLYNGVFFVDKQAEITIQGDILDFEPQSICTFSPPSQIDGFTPCIPFQDKYQAFNKTIEVPMGTQVTIYWVKNGYAVIKKSFIAKDGPKCPSSAIINPSEYRIIIPKKIFYVTAPSGVPITQFDIRINHQLMEGDSMEIFETYYQQGLVVSITARGFSEWRKTGVHPQLDRQLTVTLSKQSYHYEFAIPTYENGKNANNDAIVTVDTYRKLHTSPIKGYSLEGARIQEGEGHINRLFLDDNLFSKFKYMAYGFAACIIVLLMYAGCSAMEDYEFKLGWPPIEKVKKATPSPWDTAGDNIEDLNQVNTDSINVISYLENNETWQKDSLENYDTTKGLFGELNTFNLNGLKSRKEGVLNGSSKYREIVDKLGSYLEKGWNPHKGKEKNGGNYNSETDKGIKIVNYLKWLDEEHAEEDMFPKDNNVTQPKMNSIISDKPVSTNPNPTSSNPQQPKGGTSRGGVK